MTDIDENWHEARGYQVTDASRWLGLTPAEDLQVQFRVALTLLLKRRRERAGLTQIELAERIGTSQSRVAKIEACDKTVSTDLILRAVAATGATLDDVAEAVTRKAA